MRNYESVCYNCFSEKTGGDVCPHCGFNSRFFQQPENALPEGSILHGRYLVGRVTGRTADEITYSGFDLTLESLLQIHEYAPTDTVREADACTVAFADEAQRYDRKKEAKEFLERTKVLLRGKTSVTGGSALIDLFEENNTAYYISEHSGTVPPANVNQTTQPGTVPAANVNQTFGGAPSKKNTRLLLIGAVAAAVALAIILPLALRGKKTNGPTVSSSSPQVTQEPQLTVAPQQSVTPQPTQAPTQEPTQTPTSYELTETFESSRMAYRILYPAGADIQEDSTGMDLITLGESTRLIVTYGMYAGVPLWSAEDVLKAPESALAVVMGSLKNYNYEGVYASDDGTMVEVDYSVDASDGKRQGFVIFVDSDNGPGCYEITGVYPEGGSEQSTALYQMAASFSQTGDINHGYEIIGGDSESGVRAFVYGEHFAGEVYKMEDGEARPRVRVDVSVNGDGCVLLQRGEVSFTPAQYIENCITMYKAEAYQIVNDTYEVTCGLNTFLCVDLVQQAGDQSSIVTLAATQIDDSLVTVVAEQVVHEDQKVISESVQTVLSECLNSVDLVP